jgi:exopolyphosphatase/guanosine-5'-triphosphate,3'-diphosphate pyrophosphatase
VRVAVVDIGTNSTRLLIADVVDGRVTDELARESIVTRLGQGVDATGALADEAMDRVFDVLDRYRHQIERLDVEGTTAVLTSAVRDASNGAAFTETVRERYGLEARTIAGDEEAGLTFLGATSERDDGGRLVVIDIGGGSTEFVVGASGAVSFHVSVQAGVVRMTERHLHGDPPHPDEVAAMVDDVRTVLHEGVPPGVRQTVDAGVAVAGTATQSAAIELGLEPYDPKRVHGHVLDAGVLEELLARLAALSDEDRRKVPGLDPARAPTIVAGVAMLRECLRLFGLDRVEVSEHDILRGAALRRAAAE